MGGIGETIAGSSAWSVDDAILVTYQGHSEKSAANFSREL